MGGDELNASLAAIPVELRTPLLAEFIDALTEYRSGDWEKVGTKAGKFCEVAFTICDGHTSGSYARAPSKPKSMLHACQQLERFNASKGRSMCIQVPRVLIALYELRNNRSIGHVGGEVNPNQMDAEFFLRGMKWIVAEFVRFYSRLPEDRSRALVEAISGRTARSIWRQGKFRRVLDPSKSARDKALILAYTENGAIAVTDLSRWMEYSNVSRLRTTILKQLHDDALIHFDKESDTVQILPPGQRLVEVRDLLAER